MLLLLIILVTSITTAVVTVTLTDQSPKAGIVNTVSQVIERVIPGATTTIVRIEKETPTANEGEQIVKATESVSSAVVDLVEKTDKGNRELGTGFVVRDGLVVTALKNIPSDLASTSTVNIVKSGIVAPAQISALDTDNNIAFLKFTATSTLSAVNLTFNDIPPVNGQTSVALAYSDSGNPDIMIGIVMGVIGATSSTTPNQNVNIIRTSSVIGDNIGGPVVGLDGKVMGIGISRGYVLSATTLKALIDQVK